MAVIDRAPAAHSLKPQIVQIPLPVGEIKIAGSDSTDLARKKTVTTR